MTEDKSHAGNAPAEPSANGGSPEEILEREMVPSVSRLRLEVGQCQALIADCAVIVRDTDQALGMRALAAATAAKLTSASAQAAGAIARLADAETRQRLASARLEDLGYARARARAQNRREQDSRSQKSTFNYEESEADNTEEPENSWAGPRVHRI